MGSKTTEMNRMPQAVEELVERMQKSCRFQKLAISQTGFVFDPQTGKSYTVNHTGLVTLELLKNGASKTETAEELSNQYNIPVEIAETSVESFLLQLGRYL